MSELAGVIESMRDCAAKREAASPLLLETWAATLAVSAVRDASYGEQPMSLRERIWFMESECNFSMRALAKKLDVDVGYLSRLKSGEKANPSDEVLRKLGLARRVGYVVVPQAHND